MTLSDLLAALSPTRPPAAVAGKALADLRSCLPYLTAAGESRAAELSYPEMAALTRAAGANEGRGYAPQTLFNAERAYKYPTAPVVAAYARVAELAQGPGWLEGVLVSQGEGRWRKPVPAPEAAPMAMPAEDATAPLA